MAGLFLGGEVFLMFKLLKLFAWLLVAGVLLGSFDQLMMRVPMKVPGVSQAQTFYVDFRGRLLGLIGIDGVAKLPEKSIEQVIEATQKLPETTSVANQRYLYVDDSGALQFADSFELVPPQFRKSAQPLAD